MNENITLENAIFQPTYIFFKFGSESRLEDLQKKGHIYMKNMKYFVNLESKMLKKGKSDGNEARLFQAVSMQLIDAKTDEVFLQAKNVDVADTHSLKKPIFCISAFNVFEKITKFDCPNFESTVKFDDKMIKDFSDKDNEYNYVLVISDMEKFLKRIRKKLNKKNIGFKCGRVEYRDTKLIYKEDNNLNFNTPFNKDLEFKYQKEFRILLDKEVDDHYEFSIGSIEDISKLLPAEMLISGIKIKGKLNKITEIKQ